MRQSPFPTLARATLALVFLLLCSNQAPAQEWLEADVVLLGESHTSREDHENQLRALALLASRDAKPVVAAEMFREDSQSELERFNQQSSFLDFEADFWSRQWGHPYELYRPLWRLVKEKQLELSPLRPSLERTEAFKKEGVAAAALWLGEFYLGPQAYRDHMASIAARHMPQGHEVKPELVERYFLVQCFWDEYMTWRILELKRARPHQPIAVLVGHGHLHPEWGIPARLKRRAPELRVITLEYGTGESPPDLRPESALRPR